MKRTISLLGMTFAALLIALMGSGCLTTSKNNNAKELSEELYKNLEVLQKNYDQGLTNIADSTKEIDQRIRRLFQLLILSKNAELTLKKDALISEIEAKENQIVRSFDDEMWKKLGPEFSKILEQEYWGRITPKLKLLDSEAKKLEEISDNSPNDGVAYERAVEEKLKVLKTLLVANENEVSLREKFVSQLSTLRGTQIASIRQKFQDLRDTVTGKYDEALKTQNSDLQDSVSKLNLEEFREQILKFQNTQSPLLTIYLQAINQLKDHLNRPSGIELFKDGLFETAKLEIKESIPDLGPLTDLLNKNVDDILDIGKNFVSDQTKELETLANDSIDDLLKKASKSANDFVNKPAN